MAYCTGFWSTNIGNGFFSMGVEYALKKVLGEKNVTIVSDLQTYTTGYGRRLYTHKNQLVYLSSLDVDYIVLAGPVLSKYFLVLWKDILLELKERGIGYILLSAGIMKMDEKSNQELKEFFKECPPYAISSRDESVYKEYKEFSEKVYNGICFSFFVPDTYNPVSMSALSPYIVCNFDKIGEPEIWKGSDKNKKWNTEFEFENDTYKIAYPKLFTAISSKTDRFTDALIYALSVFPSPKRSNQIGKYKVIRTDQRFHPHYRRKIYRQENSYVADLPYGYLNIYANSTLTLSDRIHACAVTMAFGNSAMLFAKTNRCGLLERVGASGINERPVKLDLDNLAIEKEKQLAWLNKIFQV